MPGARRNARGYRFSAEDLAWLGLIPGAILTLAAIEWVAPGLKGLLDPPASYHYFPGLSRDYRPEPTEEARFLIAIAAPVALAGLVALLGSNRSGERRLDPPVIVGQIVVLGFAGWALTKTSTDLLFTTGHVAAHDWLADYLVGTWVLVGGIAIGGVLTLLLFANPQPGEWLKSVYLRAARLRWLPAAIAILAGVLWLLPGVVTDANVGETGYAAGHIRYHFEDYLAVVNGRTPLVNYVAWYASLLPVAFAPLLALFDSSVTAFSLIEVGLSLAAVLCVYAGFGQLTRNRWAALGLFLPFLAITFIPWHFEDSGVRIFSGIYYAVFPNRLFGPFVVFWLLARHLRRGGPPLWVVYLAAGLTVWNNFEFGVCSLLALIAVSLAGLHPAAPARTRARDVVLQGVAGLVGATLIVAAITLLLAGALPNPSILTYWSRLFGRDGFNLLPMPRWGFHWVLYFTYAGSLLAGVVRLVRQRGDGVLSLLLIFAAVFGLTTGQYYAGRSESTQLIALLTVWGLNVALLTWLVAGTMRGVSAAAARRYVLPTFAVLAAFGVMVAAVARVPAPWNQIQRLSHGGLHILDGTGDQAFLEAHTNPGENILFLNGGLPHRVAERAGVNNVSPWPFAALYAPGDLDRALDNLDDAGGTKVFLGLNNISSQTPAVTRILEQRGFKPVTTAPFIRIQLWQRATAG